MKPICSKRSALVAAATLTAILFALPAAAVSPESPRYFDGLQQKLIEDGFDKAAIASLYRNPNVNFDIDGIARFFAHREARLDYDQFTTARSIRKARRYMQKYQADLERIEKAYGVDREIITAIILVETRLGTFVGNSSVLNSLSSLACLLDPEVRDRVWTQMSKPIDLSKQEFDDWAARKSKWAYAELKYFLQYTTREALDAADINGSLAGALGIAQFMPSNVIAYGRDGNGDGRIDLFNHADAIASIASYLKHFGWKPGLNRRKAYKVVYHYNHSSYYVKTILKIVQSLKG